MDSSAIKAIRDLASLESVVPDSLSDDITALPADVSIVDLEKFYALRRRYRGAFATTNLAAFGVFVTSRAEGRNTPIPVFINDTNYQAKAIFNLGDVLAPGHADDTATLILPETAAFTALRKANNARFDQRSLVEWIEDWLPVTTALNADGSSLSMVSALKAIRELTIAKQSEQTSKIADFGERKSSFEDIEARGAAELPAFLSFECQPCLGLPSRNFKLRVGVLTTGEKPIFSLKIVSYESELEGIAADFAIAIVNSIGDSCKTFIGDYKA